MFTIYSKINKDVFAVSAYVVRRLSLSYKNKGLVNLLKNQ